MTMFHVRGGVLLPSLPITTAAVAPKSVPKQRAILSAAVYSRPKRSVSIFDYYESDDEWVPSIAPIISTETESDDGKVPLCLKLCFFKI